MNILAQPVITKTKISASRAMEANRNLTSFTRISASAYALTDSLTPRQTIALPVLIHVLPVPLLHKPAQAVLRALQ